MKIHFTTQFYVTKSELCQISSAVSRLQSNAGNEAKSDKWNPVRSIRHFNPHPANVENMMSQQMTDGI
jgi:hypothetical protein